MDVHYTEGIGYGRFKSFEAFPGVAAFFTTRKGGVSSAPFDSLNMGLGTDDAYELVAENRRRFFQAVQIPQDLIVRQKQVHEDQIAYVTEPSLIGDTDACYTDRENVFLTVTVADCVPILFYEPRKKIAGVIHAGWRGTEKAIARKTIEQVKSQFQADASEIVAVIGPSISVKHYEVSEDVAEKFDRQFIHRNGFPKPHLDLWQANAFQLRAAGVENITISGLCTIEHGDLFFSHRGSGGKSGRMIGVIGIK
ncbi:peptidoglycan editing factor PgeF [bacterium]|nr:peptidoglycan editing factor PgeF [bacterium]